MQTEEKTLEQTAEQGTTGSAMSPETADKWISRIEVRTEAFRSGWWSCAKSAQEMYNMEKGYDPASNNPFNILYANTEVLLPALYSNLPRPDVRTRFDSDKSQIASACEHLLIATLDDNTPGTETFDLGMQAATLGALVPGMGFARLRYYPEATCPFQYETGSYDRLIWGYAATWAKVPWISFEHSMTKEQIIEEFSLSEADAAVLRVEKQEDKDAQKGKTGEPSVEVHELWIKSSRKTVFLCKEYEKKVLREVSDDPLSLEGFYPTPGPLSFTLKAGSLDPTPMYEYYKDQATELNRVTVRLNRVLSAIKVRGVYNPLLGDDLKKILDDTEMENKLVPAAVPKDMEGKGYENQIWTLPIDKLIAVARELYAARQAILQVIYQITGIADIIRGSSAASETASAQQIKDKWSGVRLRRNQRLVAEYARSLLRLTIDAASNQLSPQQWAEITQLPYPTKEEKDAAIAQLQAFAQEQAQAAQTADPMAPPPEPQQPDPKLLETVQQLSWEEILETLQSDKMRAYVIDIESHSTIDPDAQIDKMEVTDFMQAMGQLMPGLQLLSQVPGGADASRDLLIAIASKYKLGNQLISSLKKLQPPTGPNGEQKPDDHSVEVAMINAENKMKVAKMQAETDEKLTKLQGQIDAMLKDKETQGKVVVEQIKGQVKMQETAMGAQVDAALGQQQIEADFQARREDMQFQAAQGDRDRAFQQQDKAEDRAFQAKQGDKDRQFQAKQSQQADKTARYKVDKSASKPAAGKPRR